MPTCQERGSGLALRTATLLRLQHFGHERMASTGRTHPPHEWAESRLPFLQGTVQRPQPGMTKQTSRGVVKTTGQEDDDTTCVKREQQDRAPAPATCTLARPTRRDRAWHAGMSRRNVGANPVSPILVAASVGGRPVGGTARLVSSQPAADRQQRSSGQPGGAPRHARHASRFAG